MVTHEIAVGIKSMVPNEFDVGTKGSYGIYSLHLTFSEEWDGLTKKVSFYPSHRGAPVVKNVDESDTTIPVPQEATAYSGKCEFEVSGVKSGVSVITLPGHLTVADTNKPATTPAGSPTPTEIEQIYISILGSERLPIPDASGYWKMWNYATKEYEITAYPSSGLPGQPGQPGAAGKGIVSIVRTAGDGSPGTTDTYTVTYTDNNTKEIPIYNGKDGAGTGDMLKETYDADGDGVVDNSAKVNNHTVEADVPPDAIFTGNVNPDWNAVSGDGQILNKPNTIAGYGITDAYTKTEIDNKVSAVYKYKGTVATYALLPSTGQEIGDTYNVTGDNGKNYAWNGTDWDDIGGVEALATALNNGLLTKEDFSKLAGIEAGANNYIHPTTSGNKHVPSGGTVGQILKNTTDGTGVWSDDGSLQKSGGTLTGAVIGAAGTDYTTARFRNIIISTADPTGGNNGDIWLRYTP